MYYHSVLVYVCFKLSESNTMHADGNVIQMDVIIVLWKPISMPGLANGLSILV